MCLQHLGDFVQALGLSHEKVGDRPIESGMLDAVRREAKIAGLKVAG